MMKLPRVSVVIPTYNRASLIRETIESVCAQSFRDIEILVVDDGSKDNTAEIVKGIDDFRIQYLYQENRGVAAALDTGWRAACGEYIGIIGSDDVWLPDLLDALVPLLDANSQGGVAYARAQGMDEQGNFLPQLTGAPERFPGHTLKSLLYGDFVSAIAVVVRREALAQANGYDKTLIANEDWDLWIRLAMHWSVHYDPVIRARYRYHRGNLTKSGSVRMMRVMQDRIRVLDKFYAQPNIAPELLAIKPLAYRNVYMDWAIRHFTIGQYRAGAARFRQALAYSPRPIAFIPRAVATTCFTLYLSKTRWGVALVEWFVARRRSARQS